MGKVTITTLNRMKAAGEKIAVVTSYDASFTQLIEHAGMDVILVGDSLGMVIQGHESTLPVTVVPLPVMSPYPQNSESLTVRVPGPRSTAPPLKAKTLTERSMWS